MKITIIHGQSHKGSTYKIASMLAKNISEDIKEFFLPKDFNHFCLGCNTCFIIDEKKCPHFKDLSPIIKSLIEADLIILASPVYVFHASGPMKSFLDHNGYRWMVHRPEESMFKKQAVCISTAVGKGTKSANKDMEDSLFFWGVGRIYKYGLNVYEMSYDKIPDKRKEKIKKDLESLANKIKINYGKKPCFKTRLVFNLLTLFHKKGLNEIDKVYWKNKGWLDNKRPWE